jgi:alginate O-acetyltransferase complex protein AlgI
MLFNSLQFLIFFPVVTLLYFLLPQAWRWLLLLPASCFFYMAFYPPYILVLFSIILIDYFAGILIHKSPAAKKKHFLLLSLVANLGVLAFFKYFDFFAGNINDLLVLLHLHVHPVPFLHILLPLGLSFHTFQAMSYTIEVYRGHQAPERHPGIYALYVMFYPQLVAGPIERPQRLLPQFRERHAFDSTLLLQGLRLMLWGFFKKLVIADRLAIYVNVVFRDPGHYHYLNLLLAVLFFSIQIYCDFSGYSDIAIGAARTIGFRLTDNFNRPYFATNIRRFWQRWHISLSSWFRDYVYIPLGGSRKGALQSAFIIVLVFVLSGLWHGANWTFLLWGLLHGGYLLLYLLIRKREHGRNAPGVVRNIIGALVTFILVSFAWVFFRANNLHDAFLVIRHLFSGYRGHPLLLVFGDAGSAVRFGFASTWIALLSTLFLVVVEKILPPGLETLNKKPFIDIVFCAVVLSLVILAGMFNQTSFIYFQF